MAVWHEQARQLKAAHPELAVREIAERFGVTSSAVSKALNPERTRERVRRENLRRKTEKQAWARTEEGRAMRQRIKDRHRAVCIDCGSKCGPGSKWEGVERCVACENAQRQRRHEALLDVIEAMWNEQGMTGPQIARAIGRTHPRAAGPDLQELRRRGRLTPRGSGLRTVAG